MKIAGAARGLKIERRLVKFIIPTVGLLGLYAGAFLGLTLLSFRAAPPGRLIMLLVESCFGLMVGFAIMIPVDTAIGKNASHVDLLKIPWYWMIAGITLYAAGWFIEKVAGWALPPAVSNFGLYLAGILAVWVDEPPAKSKDADAKSS